MFYLHPHPMNLSKNSLGSKLQRRAQRGFTLVETMVATMVFTMGILGVYAMMLKSYEMVTVSRHRDNGRAILLSFADQFLRLQTSDSIAGHGNQLRGMFSPHAASSLGLNWTDAQGNVIQGDTQTDPNLGLPVVLGETTDVDVNNRATGSQVLAHVFREVVLLNANGEPLAGTTPPLTAAGYMMQATFTITFPIAGRTQTQTLIVARSAR
jgi:prepilin-type N-terminal cleavage/methylation domain-containing protein